MTPVEITQLVQMGYPALVTAGFAYLARLYVNRVQDEIDYLRNEIEELRKTVALYSIPNSQSPK